MLKLHHIAIVCSEKYKTAKIRKIRNNETERTATATKNTTFIVINLWT